MGRRARRPAHTGVLLLDKPKGRTSHDVVQAVRRIFGQREVGHTGTLDPMATGLMILTLGRATRLGRFLESADKSYDGTVVLGVATTTYDAEGEVSDTAPVRVSEGAEPNDSKTAQALRTATAVGSGSASGSASMLTKAPQTARLTTGDIGAALASLTGTIDQQVPAFSAVKVGGERLHAKARRGEAVDAPTRTVHVAALELRGLREAGETVELDIHCSVSKGTYVRSLAVQIGAALGVPAHLSRLVRTRVGPHRLEQATALDPLANAETPADMLISGVEALNHLQKVVLGIDDLTDVRHGRPLTAGQLRSLGVVGAADETVLLVRADGALAAVGHLVFSAEALAEEPARSRAVRYACVLDSPDPQT